MTDAGWVLLGVVTGGTITGLFNWLLQTRHFNHTKEMFLLQNQSREVVKGLLVDMLTHPSFTDRSFEALRRPIGGYSDNDIRQFLHEVGARRTKRDDGKEWWYLVSRSTERIEKRKS